MRIESIRLEGDVDRFGGRALNVKTDRGTFRTPQRTYISQEYNYKAKLPFEPPFKNEQAEVVADLYGSHWDSFMNTNGSFNSRLRTLEKYLDKMAYTWTRFYPQIKSDIAIDDSGIKQLLELQRMSELDFITLPNLPPDVRDYHELCESFGEEVRAEAREPLFYLDMALDPPVFRERFRYLVQLSQSDLVHTIGLIYRPIRATIRNYMLLWENRERPILLQMSGVPREFPRRRGTSTMHLLQKFGIDSFSVKAGRYVPPKPSKNGRGEAAGSNATPTTTTKEELFARTKRFDDGALIFQRFHHWLESEGSLDCDCPICSDLSGESFMSRYYGSAEDYPGHVFNAANRLHETYRSRCEFSTSRQFIMDGDLADYFDRKSGLKRVDDSLPFSPLAHDLNLRQTRLDV